MSARRRQVLPFAVLGLLLATLPGCLTRRLWRDQRFHTVVQQESSSEIGVEIGWNPESSEAWAVPQGHKSEEVGGHEGGGDARAGGTWAFSPREEGDVAAVLLSGLGDFRVRRAVFQVSRRGEPGQELSSPATLLVEGAFLATGIGTVADDAAVLSSLGAPIEVLPAPLDEILRYAAAADLAPLAGQAEPHQPWRIEGCSFVDGDLSPVDAARATALLGEDFAAPTTSLRERLRRLAALRLLAVVEYGGVRTRITLRADALWLRQQLQVGADGLLEHRSHWVATERAETEGLPLAGAAGARTVPGSVRVHSVVRRYESQDGSTLRRVLLTPMALVLDVVTIGTAAYLLAWTGFGPRENPPQ